MDDLQTAGQIPPPSSVGPDDHFRLILLAAVVVFLVVSVLFLIPGGRSLSKSGGEAPQKLALSCPLASGCAVGVVTTYQAHPAFAIKLAEGTKIASAAAVVDSVTFVKQPFIEGKSPRGFYQSFIKGESCYTLTYTLPASSTLAKIELLPLERGYRLATSSASLIEEKGEGIYNFFLQLQKRPLEGSENDPDFQRCRVTNLTPAEFGQYQPLSISSFQ